MSTPNGNGRPYRVIYSERVRIALRDLLQRANALGIAQEVQAAARKIYDVLHWRPTAFGDPLADLPHTHLQRRIGTVPPLVVTFAVDEDRHLVYVLTPIKPLSGTGL